MNKFPQVLLLGNGINRAKNEKINVNIQKENSALLKPSFINYTLKISYNKLSNVFSFALYFKEKYF